MKGISLDHYFVNIEIQYNATEYYPLVNEVIHLFLTYEKKQHDDSTTTKHSKWITVM